MKAFDKCKEDKEQCSECREKNVQVLQVDKWKIIYLNCSERDEEVIDQIYELSFIDL